MITVINNIERKLYMRGKFCNPLTQKWYCNTVLVIRNTFQLIFLLQQLYLALENSITLHKSYFQRPNGAEGISSSCFAACLLVYWSCLTKSSVGLPCITSGSLGFLVPQTSNFTSRMIANICCLCIFLKTMHS